MSKGSSRLRLPATWNPARGVWETDTLNLYCGHAEPSLGTWPPSGSMRNGIASERTKSAPPTAGAASSSGPGRLLSTPVASDGGTDRGSSAGWGLRDETRKLLPAPRTSDTNGIGQHGTGGPDLRTAISLLPTPRARDGKGAGYEDDLPSTVDRLLPTPTASNPNDGESLESWEARRQRNLAKGINGNGQGTPLAIAVKLLPTPRVSDGTKGGPNQRGSKGDLMLPSAAAQLLPKQPAPRVDAKSPSTTPEDSAPAATDAPTPNSDGPMKLLPTPTTGAQEKSTRALTSSSENGRRDGGGQSSSLGLTEVAMLVTGERPKNLPPIEELPPASRDIVEKLLPTPMAGDANGTRNATAGRKRDNPNVNEGWTLSDVIFSGQLSLTSDPEPPTSNGDPTSPPSDAGKPSSDDEPPGPPMLWDA